MKPLRPFLLFWVFVILAGVTVAPRFIPQTLFVGSRNHFDERLPRWLYDNALPRFFWLWANLDGGHYLSIARDGYYEYEHGFFPLYPLAIRLVRSVTQSPYVISGLAVTYVSLWIFMTRFWRLLRLDFNERDSRRVMITFLSFPVAFYLLSVYTDSLYLMLTVFCFWFARKRQWWRAGITGGLVALARFPGIALFPALLVEMYLSEKKNWKQFVPVVLVPLATLGYLLFIQITDGDWRLFVSSMGVWKQDQYVFPLQTAFRYVKILGTVRDVHLVYLVSAIEFIASLGAITFLVIGRKLVRPSYLVYAASYLIIPLSSGTFQGMPRYVMHTFPVLIILALLLKKKWYTPILVGFSFVLQIIFVAYFSQGHFVS